MKVYSWGANSYGQLGLGFRSEHVDRPLCIASDVINSEELKNIKSICGSGGHTFILTAEGSVYGCGWNNIGQLGTIKGGVVTELTKLEILDDYGVISLASTWDSCYAVTEDGLCIGWGSNVYGQLGKPMNEVINVEKPIVLADNVKQVACGVRHCIILGHNGKLLSSGDYKYGQLGRKVAILDHDFKRVDGLRDVESIACGFNHSLALLESREIYSWGANKWGQLGIDPFKCKCVATPTKINLEKNWIVHEIHCGWSSSHLLTDNGIVVNFGKNTYGQLGDGSQMNRWEPKPLKDFHFQRISVGSEHCLGLDENGKLLSWGWNEHGSCGNGSTSDVLVPSKVAFRRKCKNIKYFEASIGHNFLIIED